MKARTFALLVAVMCPMSGMAAAQEAPRPQPQSTAAPIEVRYAVLHTEDWDTLRLDKATGEVWQLRQSSSKFSGERSVWRPIPAPEDERTQAGVNYQLSNQRNAGTFLLNVHTGATWILRNVSSELRWVPLTVEG